MKPGQNIVILEFVEGTGLDSMSLPFSTAKQVFEKIVNIVKQMHLREVYHLDLKPENIIIKPNFDPVIIDLGSA